VPLGAWARLTDEGDLVIDACIAALDGTEHYRDRRRCAPEEGREEGRSLATDLLDAGGDEIVNRILGDARRTSSGSPFRA
jgi:hydroxymethylbilane synthase